MTANNPQKTQKTRPIDPNVLQWQASNPAANIWVNASAGTGKTKVLTDRILRLLLPRDNGAPATPPHKILGITFTKAGAGEMLLRISETLRHWAILPTESDDKTQKTLRSELTRLTGNPPTLEQIAAARTLFATVSNARGGLNIMTIHAFCQSVLARFPLEAGIAPTLKTLEEAQSRALILQAQKNIIGQASADKTSPLNTALTTITTTLTDTQFSDIIAGIISEQHEFRQLLKDNFGVDGLHTATCAHLGIDPALTPETLLLQACTDQAVGKQALLDAASTLQTSTSKTDLAKAAAIHTFLEQKETNRPEHLGPYCDTFLKKDGEIRATLITKALAKKHAQTQETLQTEANRLFQLQDQLKTIQNTAKSHALFTLAEAILTEYEALKAAGNALDYDDMITKTLALLQSNAAWVLYKLDQGIDHILVDEAQDTNPEQWQIILALTEEFFAQTAETHASTRSLFVVGDQKQSIYSFQRASPAAFHHTKAALQQKITASRQPWQAVNLNISFRSTPAVLDAVDHVFAPGQNPLPGMGDQPISHTSFRRGQAGCVQLWPLEEMAINGQDDFWQPPITQTTHQTGADKLAAHIATTIQNWLTNKEILESANRPIKPSDIMILMRSRSSFVHTLTRALKDRNIPVSGTDRLVVTDHIGVKDLLALANVTLLPEDDLTLACLLKSPLIGYDESALMHLATTREDASLWSALQTAPDHKTVATYLQTAIQKAQTLRPYEFLNWALSAPCPASAISGLSAMKDRLGEDAADPLQELLTLALHYEQDHIPSLQLFCEWLAADNHVIKRESHEGQNEVRIMTIHGAKGLQAPIVIMPDTIRTAASAVHNIADRILWPSKTDHPVPLWSPRAARDHSAFTKARQTIKQQEQEEYNRLLYVAMTRAEDRLYIGGYTGQKPPLEDSWYTQIQTALKNHPDIAEEGGTLTLTNAQTATPDRAVTDTPQTQTTPQIPNWLTTPITPETNALAPLNPSKLTKPTKIQQTTTDYRSPTTDHRKRGNLTHKLLEILPDLPPENHITTAESYITKFGQDLPLETQESIITQTLATLKDPLFTAIFKPEALAEAPISGTLPDGRTISGIIDRLLITDQAVWIIDYKTGTPPKSTPPAYQAQMQAYAALLRAIYPNHPIHAALLWTEGPTLEPITLDAPGV